MDAGDSQNSSSNAQLSIKQEHELAGTAIEEDEAGGAGGGTGETGEGEEQDKPVVKTEVKNEEKQKPVVLANGDVVDAEREDAPGSFRLSSFRCR
jgi:hypothetical protein